MIALRSVSLGAPGVGERHPEDATSTCNIGPAELRRRQRAAAVASTLLAILLFAVATGYLPRWSMPFFAPIVGAVVVTILQVTMRFCVAFGLAGLVGMGDAEGRTTADAALLAPHRRRARLMVAAGLGATIAWFVVTGVLVLALG